MQTLKNLVGIRTNAQKSAARNQEDAMRKQNRAANAAQEDGGVARADAAASGRRLRGTGRRALAFAGTGELGVNASLAGG